MRKQLDQSIRRLPHFECILLLLLLLFEFCLCPCLANFILPSPLYLPFHVISFSSFACFSVSSHFLSVHFPPRAASISGSSIVVRRESVNGTTCCFLPSAFCLPVYRTVTNSKHFSPPSQWLSDCIDSLISPPLLNCISTYSRISYQLHYRGESPNFSVKVNPTKE